MTMNEIPQPAVWPFAHEDCPNCFNDGRRETTGMVCQSCGYDHAARALPDEEAR